MHAPSNTKSFCFQPRPSTGFPAPQELLQSFVGVVQVVLTREPGGSWGLCINEDTMVLSDLDYCATAVHHEVLRSCVGKVLMTVDDNVVYFANEAS